MRTLFTWNWIGAFERRIVVIGLLGFSCSAFPSEPIVSPNGYSGLGLIPTADVLPVGAAVVAFDPIIPGDLHKSGYNNQLGLGLYGNLELVGRLATNDLKCNMFKVGACPANTIRDFSASMKWSLPLDWLKQNKAGVAVGVTDMGGAAVYFKSYYVVGTKSFDNIDVSVGQGKSAGDRAILKGTFGALTWKPKEWAKLSLQRIGTDSWANAAVSAPILDSGVDAWLTFNHRITESTTTDKSWIGWGISIPMDRTGRGRSVSSTSSASASAQNREVVVIKPSDLAEAFKQRGFFNPKIGKRANGSLVFELESSSYVWNIVDGVGVALGIIAGAYGNETQPQDFELVLTSRGVRQVLVRGEASCVKAWLAEGNPCSQLSIQSFNQRARSPQSDESVDWTNGSFWSFRPEVIISPNLLSAYGTEFGAFDIHVGANVNTVLPLWTGATWEVNDVHPTSIKTRGFEQGSYFYGSRLKPVTSRRLLHQLFNFQSINTQARLSLGMAYSVWNGRQLETNSQTDNGRHKLGWTVGSFKTDVLRFNNERSYHLLNYRFVPDDRQSTSTELTYGKYWAGDKGFNISQRFWHGDTALNIYLRRTRMTEISPLVSFAGIQFSIPLTPRRDKGFEHLLVRGTSQFVYTLETRVFDKQNLITGGYGEVPRIGDTLMQTFNHDRNSTQYLESNMGRIKNAYFNLTDE